MDNLVKSLFPDLSTADQALVGKALSLVDKCSIKTNHDSHHRPKGIDVAVILTAVHIDIASILAALLSDSRLQGHLNITEMQSEFGDEVGSLVKDVLWLNSVSIYKPELAKQPDQSEILRRMLLAMTHDVRAVLIKLAYRIQRLRNLNHESEEIRHYIARETLDIYAPLANRLGVSQFKWELEDLAFRYLEPEQYRSIATSLADKRIQREASINVFLHELEQALTQHAIQARIYGRPKHIYSIWCKMRRKNLAIEDLYDLLAVRVIVDDLTACYTALGLAHSHWQHIPKEFDDYIANPKENGYQSLHTVVLDKQGNRIEIQIRTHAMHEFAELGVAAHWRYKEGGKHNAASEKNITSLRLLLEERGKDNLLESFHTELFSDRVFVLTPNGKLIDLIKGATPLDFAYAVHTEIGHNCRGAKVNGQIKPLSYALKSGDQVEIITVKNGQPKHNWLDSNLGYLKTPRAISKVKSWFKQQQLSQNISDGKALFDKEIKRLGLKQVEMEDLLKHFKMPDDEHLYKSLGRGDINNRQLASALKIPELTPLTLKLSPPKADGKSNITVADMDNVVTTLAHCCSPVNGDAIIGYITHKRGITIHRADCENIRHLNQQHLAQLVKAEWRGRHNAHHNVPIIIEAMTAQNLLADVSQLLQSARVQITDAALKTRADQTASLSLQIEIANTEQLSLVLGRISQLPQVMEVRRKT